MAQAYPPTPTPRRTADEGFAQLERIARQADADRLVESERKARERADKDERARRCYAAVLAVRDAALPVIADGPDRHDAKHQRALRLALKGVWDCER